jgi:hypothetical protein
MIEPARRQYGNRSGKGKSKKKARALERTYYRHMGEAGVRVDLKRPKARPGLKKK